MSGRLTKRAVDAAKPGETVWDGELPGFGLRVSDKGAKSYVLKYRAHGRQRWATIGRHGQPMPIEAQSEAAGVWTPKTARDEALRLLGRVRDGADPALERQEARRAETLAQFTKRYLKDHVDAHLKPKTGKEARRNLEQHILPQLGQLKLRDITREHVARFHRSKRETPYLANRCLALISHMLSTAEEWGVCPGGSNVCRRLKKYKEHARKRYLSTDEARALGVALKEAEAAGWSPSGVAIIRLLALTGARRGEIEALRWDEVDLKRAALDLGDSKTGEKTICLAPAALKILDAQPRVEGTPYVFPANSGDGHYQGLGKLWRHVRKEAKIKDVRLHDLRHTFASFGAAGGLSLPIIGALLGHKNAATTQRYAHLSNDPVAHAANRTGSAVAAALSGKGGKVVSLQRKRQQ